MPVFRRVPSYQYARRGLSYDKNKRRLKGGCPCDTVNLSAMKIHGGDITCAAGTKWTDPSSAHCGAFGPNAQRAAGRVDQIGWSPQQGASNGQSNFFLPVALRQREASVSSQSFETRPTAAPQQNRRAIRGAGLCTQVPCTQVNNGTAGQGSFGPVAALYPNSVPANGTWPMPMAPQRAPPNFAYADGYGIPGVQRNRQVNMRRVPHSQYSYEKAAKPGATGAPSLTGGCVSVDEPCETPGRNGCNLEGLLHKI